jgi:WS/DGAT/MGAT family acyltransferase
MSEHLTPLDATFLQLEEADDSAHMHIGGIMVFDPTPAGGVPTREQLTRHIAHRLGQLPRYGQRLSEPHTGGLSWPTWEDDPEFSLGRHITRAALPAPGGDRELAEWASGFFSQRLDRHRPLWEMTLVEGLEGGRWALATKTHHCMVDGVGSVDVGHLLLDTSPDVAPEPSAGDHLPHAAGSAHSARLDPLASLARVWKGLVPLDAAAHAAAMGIHSALHPRAAISSARSALELIVREELHAAPGTSLNEAIGTGRRFEVVRVPLEDMKAIKDALGGTINDVVLAVSASGLRALLLARGEALPEQGLRAMVPMNVRLTSEHLALGNRISSLFVDLPVAESSTVERYFETVARSAALKSDGKQAAGTNAVIELAGLAPPVIHATIARALYATRLFNVTITNVPGPQQTLYAFGAPLREVHPLVPLAASHAVGVAILSYDGNAFFGVVADRDSVADLNTMLEGMSASVRELLAEAHPSKARPLSSRRPAAAVR